MARDLILGHSGRDWSRGSSNSKSGSDDPHVWTPDTLHSEFARLLNVVDSVNVEMSKAVEDKKISAAEWKRWFATYQSAHAYLSKPPRFVTWSGDIMAARKHEQEVNVWRELLKSRGAVMMTPGRPKDNEPLISTGTAILVAGGALAVGYLFKQLAGFTGLFKRRPSTQPSSGEPSWPTTSSSNKTPAAGRAGA